MHIIRRLALALVLSCLTGSLAPAAWPNRPPAQQISVSTNGWVTLLGVNMSSTNEAQQVFDWIDANWPTNISRTNVYATKVYVDSHDVSVSNYAKARDSSITNWAIALFLTTNSSPTMKPGSTWNFKNGTITNNADTGTEIVNFQTLSNYSGAAVSNLTNPRGYIKGAYPNWISTTQLSITNGDGYCSNKYFKITSPIVHNPTIPAGTNYLYIYLDYSASTFPSTISVISTSTAPAYSTVNQGWYNGADRCIGAVYHTNSCLVAYGRSREDGYVWTRLGRALTTAGAPSGEWQATTAEASTYLPINASRALVALDGEDAADACTIGITTRELDDAAGTVSDAPIGALAIQDSYVEAAFKVWVPLGPSRNVSWFGNNDDTDQNDCSVGGYEVAR